jgi:excisionase family DNA binding protein
MESDLHTLHFLTLAEVAELMHLSKRTVLRLIQSKNFPAFRVGGQWRISETQLLQWIESREMTSDARYAGS